MDHVIGFIYNSPSSGWMRLAGWLIPTVQTVHILALAALMGSAVLLDMKLAGVMARTDAGATLVRRYLPVLWGALAVLFVSGFTLLWAEPERVLSKTIFWVKMSLVLLAFLLTFLLRKRLLDREAAGEPVPAGRFDKAFGWIALLIWIVALGCGRWIAYSY